MKLSINQAKNFSRKNKLPEKIDSGNDAKEKRREKYSLLKHHAFNFSFG